MDALGSVCSWNDQSVLGWIEHIQKRSADRVGWDPIYPLCRVHHFFSFLMQTTDDIYYFDTDGTTMQLLETEPNSVDPTNVHGEKESGSLLRRGWKSLKKGVKTTGDKIKESGVGVTASVHRRWLRERPRRSRRSATATSASASHRRGCEGRGAEGRTGHPNRLREGQAVEFCEEDEATRD